MEFDELYKNKGNFSEDDVRAIIDDLGYLDDDMDIDDDNDWDDETMNAYADYIHNYWYTYKDIAKSVDPSIDPNEEHLGPMAQDIEQVNPACVKETPEGVKEVDTARLAMMNAGVVADLVRRLMALEERVDVLEEGNNGTRK